jgi:tRNA A37 methylthiotransferase MiaB
MNRDHTVQDFVDIVASVRSKFPDATIATDIIVGYPTETEDDFQATISLLKSTKPDIVNVSAFSPRPGTKAKELKPLNSVEMKRRTSIISRLIKQIAEEQRKKYIGRVFQVLVTEKNAKKGDFTGRNSNYSQVVVKGFKGKLSDFANVKITDVNHGSLFGVVSD